MPKKAYVPLAELEAEEAELRALKDRLSYISDEIRRVETSRYEPLWRDNVRLARTIRYWETRLKEYETRLTELRRRGWARLTATEREEYLRLRDTLIPRARSRLTELHEAQDKVITELWRITEELTPLRTEATTLRTRITTVQKAISQKVVTALSRVKLNLYIIVEAKTRYFPRKTEATARKHGRLVRRTYPKGKFQVIYQVDGFTVPETGTVLEGEDPLKTLLETLREDAAKEVNEKFGTMFIGKQFTLGETNIVLAPEELGRPPKKMQIARTVEGPVEPGMSPTKDWVDHPEEYIMTQAEYNSLIADMTHYVEELKRIGAYQEAL